MPHTLASSYWIAQILGPILLVIALGMVVNRQTYIAMAKDFLASPALIYLAGLLTLTAGLAIVLSHNLWVMGWPVVITIFGWLAIVGGFFRMAFPNIVARIGQSMIEKHSSLLWLSIMITALLGGALTWYGYLA